MQAIDLLIFKGREELEVYLTGHKQRHHVVSWPSAVPRSSSGQWQCGFIIVANRCCRRGAHADKAIQASVTP
jgi:hypothetical protein